MEGVFRFSLLRIMRLFAAKDPSHPCRLMAVTEGAREGSSREEAQEAQNENRLPSLGMGDKP